VDPPKMCNGCRSYAMGVKEPALNELVSSRRRCETILTLSRNDASIGAIEHVNSDCSSMS
jgi:hypothetical protein